MERFPDTKNKDSVGVKMKRAQPIIYEKCSCQADNFTNYAGNNFGTGWPKQQQISLHLNLNEQIVAARKTVFQLVTS